RGITRRSRLIPRWSKRIWAPVMPEAALLKPALLKTAELNAWYGESHVLHGVDFEVGEGELVTLLGRNGAGKTTILKSIMGIVGQRRGSVSFAGHELV